LKEINRILKKNGVLIILNVNWERCNGQEFISYKLDYVKNLISGKKVGLILKSKRLLRIEDYFWSKNDYSEMLKESNFKIKIIREPMAEDNRQEWISEDKCSPFLIIVGEK
jgi:ubiquinone/menaquinone biosynthesis C-methylase UbiE